MDADGDGKISYQEFTNGIFTKGPIMVEHFLGPMDRLASLPPASNEMRNPGYIDIPEDDE